MMKQLKHRLELKKKEQRCHQQEEKQPIQVVALIFERVIVLFLHTSKSGACIFLSNYYDVIKELFFINQLYLKPSCPIPSSNESHILLHKRIANAL
jgi:hypothetical protein